LTAYLTAKKISPPRAIDKVCTTRDGNILCFLTVTENFLLKCGKMG
jgi:hypothetical protein